MIRTDWFTWDWAEALRCTICALPAGLVVASGDPSEGLAWAIGILPVAAIGMAPTRRARMRVVIMGLLYGVSAVVGSLIAQTTVTTIVGMCIVSFATAILTSRMFFGLEVMILCAPIVAAGLSYQHIGRAILLGGIMVVGSIFSYLVCLPWPEQQERDGGLPEQPLPKAAAVQYGLQLGLAAASAAGIGIAIHTDHVGWATATVLFVMRPSEELQVWRSIGRAVSVTVGAFTAVVFVYFDPSLAVLAVFAVATVAAAGATNKSTWYITPLFGTFIVLTLLLYANASTTTEQWRFKERVSATILGIALAYFFGHLVPKAVAKVRSLRGSWVYAHRYRAPGARPFLPPTTSPTSLSDSL